ncbi:MAG: PorT family protein [Candidatus Cloacimonetes bacterium]|nr:PorT family protein [Candidatus Cloacimonadota bacterium]
MKRRLFFVILLIFSVSLVFGQKQQGLKLGINRANITGKDLGDVTPLTGYHSGAFEMYPLMDNIIFHLELIYNLKGAKNEYSFPFWDGDVIVSQTYTFHYLEMPLLFKYNYRKDKFRLQPYIGPSIAMLIDAKREYTEDWGGEIFSGTDDIRKNVKDIEYSLNFGADVMFPLLSEQILIGVRYNLGLSEILENVPQKAKNRVLMFSFGYILRERS